MNAKEFKLACDLEKTSGSLSHVDLSVFDGFGMRSYAPIVATLEQIAALVRWQCRCMNGQYDNHNLTEIANTGRTKFIVV